MEGREMESGRKKAHAVAALDVFGSGAADTLSDVVLLGC